MLKLACKSRAYCTLGCCRLRCYCLTLYRYDDEEIGGWPTSVRGRKLQVAAHVRLAAMPIGWSILRLKLNASVLGGLDQ